MLFRSEPKQKQHPGVDVTGDGNKVQCCKEQYCIGTWNVRSMKQSKLEVVKQEMTRVNTDILGIRELRWRRMGEFNSDDHYIYYCGQESLRRHTRPSRTNTHKRCPFHYRGLECKSRKSRDTWSNRQIWPWSMKQAKG